MQTSANRNRLAIIGGGAASMAAAAMPGARLGATVLLFRNFAGKTGEKTARHRQWRTLQFRRQS